MTLPLQLGVTSEATFDASRKNRFLLRRIWDEKLPSVAFCMLNPSTAAEDVDDPTVRRVQAYARAWGYGAATVVNIFSWRATDPRELHKREETWLTTQENFKHIRHIAESADLFVCGWGAHGQIDGRSARIREALSGRAVYALRVLGNGEPGHPLYLPGKLRPVEWKWEKAA